MQSLINRHFSRDILVPGNELGADQLVRQGHRREQHQQRVNGGGVSELGSAKEPCNPDVVNQVGGADHAGADQHDHAAAEELGPQSSWGAGSSLSRYTLIDGFGSYDYGLILLYARLPRVPALPMLGALPYSENRGVRVHRIGRARRVL